MYPRYMGVIRLVFMFNFNQLDIHKKLVLSQQIYNEAQKTQIENQETPWFGLVIRSAYLLIP